MRTVALLVALVLATPFPALARGGGGGFGRGWGGHGGWGRGGFHGGGSRVFIGGGLWVAPWSPWGPPWGPSWGPGWGPSWGSGWGPGWGPSWGTWAYPPPYGDPGASAEEPPEAGGEARADSEAADTAQASYGLVQLRGVPDGASVDLDGRFWLTARALDGRWLALPSGDHTVTIRVADARPVERRVDVKSGVSQIVRLGPFPHSGR
jgi:hypothetical protein